MENETLEYIQDANRMTATKLKEKYPLTYNSWKNMKSRRKTHGAIVSTEFDKFSDFLKSMKPRPAREFTLDRVDASDPEYSVKKCRWLDKKGQSNNRRNSIKIEHDGQLRTVAEISAMTGLSADTLRRRRDRGWSDTDVVNGRTKAPRARGSGWPRRRSSDDVYHVTMKWPWLGPNSAVEWESEYQQYHDLTILIVKPNIFSIT